MPQTDSSLPGILIQATNSEGYITLGQCAGAPASLAVTSDKFAKGCDLTDTTSGKQYSNIGSLSSPVWESEAYDIYEVSRTLDQTEILALNSSPIELVPASGDTSECIWPLAVLMAYTYDTAPFATNVNMYLYHDGSTDLLWQVKIDQVAHTFGPWENLNPSTISGNVTIANAPLMLSVETGDPTGGGPSSQIKVTVLYTKLNYLVPLA